MGNGMIEAINTGMAYNELNVYSGKVGRSVVKISLIIV